METCQIPKTKQANEIFQSKNKKSPNKQNQNKQNRIRILKYTTRSTILTNTDKKTQYFI